ncbi:uncharacterized protein LOC135825046 [Sycon ciliatum]|uniref:uncharacterized protein LOC135825046 n=1 Tax=Sycon ciliatum TaxID=27933 RepID=UPI0031F64C2D
MHNFVESGMRGGISMVSHRHVRANNPEVKEYDDSKPTTYIQYLDANNLYGWAMSQHLPVSDFQWEEPTEELLDTILKSPIDSPRGYFLQVDLVVPEEVHDYLNDYPPAPERMIVTEDMMSPYQRTLIEKLKVTGLNVPKLVPNLCNKASYVLHYRNLQLYIELGLKVTSVSQVLSFQQEPWMEPYIRKNTELRKQASSDFEKDLYKLLNNAVFGKTMENVRKRVNLNLMRAEDEKHRLLKAVAKPSFDRVVIYDKDLLGVSTE